MTKPYDTALHNLVDRHLDDWVAFLCRTIGASIGQAKVLNTNVSVTRHTDRLIRVNAEPPYILHVEFEVSRELGVPSRLLSYNVNAYETHGMDVESIVVLLRPTGNPSDITGTLTRQSRNRPYLTFRYHVIRVWELPFESLLQAGPGLLPLATLTNPVHADLSKTVAITMEKLRSESVSDTIHEDDALACYILMGLRYSPDLVRELFRGYVMLLEESTTYQWILKDGLEKGLKEGLEKGVRQGLEDGKRISTRSHIILLGSQKLGAAPSDILIKLDAIQDLAVLEAFLKRTLTAASWDEVIQGS